jgi:predicted transcriptional regulator
MEKEKAMMLAKKPQDTDGELVELCRMMRLMSERDVDATLAQVLKTMLVSARDRPVGGSELAKASGINRITIIHHLKRLEIAGFVRRDEGKYIMRVHSAEDMLMEFRKEMEETFAEMDELAREIDEQFEQMGKGAQDINRRRRLP